MLMERSIQVHGTAQHESRENGRGKVRKKEEFTVAGTPEIKENTELHGN